MNDLERNMSMSGGEIRPVPEGLDLAFIVSAYFRELPEERVRFQGSISLNEWLGLWTQKFEFSQEDLEIAKKRFGQLERVSYWFQFWGDDGSQPSKSLKTQAGGELYDLYEGNLDGLTSDLALFKAPKKMIKFAERSFKSQIELEKDRRFLVDNKNNPGSVFHEYLNLAEGATARRARIAEKRVAEIAAENNDEAMGMVVQAMINFANSRATVKEWRHFLGIKNVRQIVKGNTMGAKESILINPRWAGIMEILFWLKRHTPDGLMRLLGSLTPQQITGNQIIQLTWADEEVVKYGWQGTGLWERLVGRFGDELYGISEGVKSRVSSIGEKISRGLGFLRRGARAGVEVGD